jgi:hypothetical protein
MSAAGAFLSYVEIFVEVNGAVRTSVEAAPATRAFFRVYDNQPIFSFVYGALYRACRETGRIFAVHTQCGDIVHLDLGHAAPDVFIHLKPELAGVRLGFGVWSPVVADMFVLAGNLAAIASVAN